MSRSFVAEKDKAKVLEEIYRTKDANDSKLGIVTKAFATAYGSEGRVPIKMNTSTTARYWNMAMDVHKSSGQPSTKRVVSSEQPSTKNRIVVICPCCNTLITVQHEQL